MSGVDVVKRRPRLIRLSRALILREVEIFDDDEEATPVPTVEAIVVVVVVVVEVDDDVTLLTFNSVEESKGFVDDIKLEVVLVLIVVVVVVDELPNVDN